MKILLLGKNGQVGWELQRTLAPLAAVIALGRNELDLLDANAIRRVIRTVKPDLIVNAAAYTAVDKAEEESELAMALNGFAPGILAEEAVLGRAALVHFSTDYVFDGLGAKPYTEEDKPNPINTYGKTKLEGDRLIQEKDVPHLIFRTSWVYSLRGSNFLLSILRLAREKEKLKVVNDQIGSPTWSRMIAEATALILCQGLKNIRFYIEKNKGLYNLSAAGHTSWHGFAKEILQLVADSDIKCREIDAISTDNYKTPARRPQFSVLDNKKFYRQFCFDLPSWEMSLLLALSDYHQVITK
jgi:dTDP-4-dehydrorhamnose reductase